MKEFFINLIKVLLSILIILFIETYFYKFFSSIGITLNKTNITNLIVYIIEFVFIFIIYNNEIKSAFSKYHNKLSNNILYTLIAYIVLFIVMMITNYLIKIIANNINLTYNGLHFINIFNQSFNFELITVFLISLIIIPFVKVVIFVLGINNLLNSRISPFISGLTYALYEGYLIGGNLGGIFINVIDEFVLFTILSYIYKKNGNIAFSIITFILYEIFSCLLINRFL